MVDTPSNTPQGGPDYKQWDMLREFISGMGRLMTGQRGPFGMPLEMLKNNLGVGVADNTVLGGREVVEAIRELTNVIREVGAAAGVGGGMGGGGNRQDPDAIDAARDQKAVKNIFGKLFERDKNGNLRFDRVQKKWYEVPTSEGGVSADDVDVLEQTGALGQMNELLRRRLLRRRKLERDREAKERKQQEMAGGGVFNVPDERVESSKPKAQTTANEYSDEEESDARIPRAQTTSNVAGDEEWVDLRSLQKYQDTSDGKTPWSMYAATSGTDSTTDAVNSMNVYRDEMRRLHNTLTSILEGVVTDLRQDNARLEEIERYFRQVRETL